MLKALAWPYPVFEGVECTLQSAIYENVTLTVSQSSKGWIIAGGQLRDRLSGPITIQAQITTPVRAVAESVFGTAKADHIACGIRVLCKESKFRAFFGASSAGAVAVQMPLDKLRGIVELTPVFVAGQDDTASNGVPVQEGAVLGIAAKPIFLTVDEDWTGETIPVDWLDFSANNLPREGFMHVELSGGSQVPKVWLNLKYRNQLEHVLLRTGDASPVGLAGAAMREFFWMQVWEKVVVWAINDASDEHEEWPATRIKKHWASQFAENSWELPSADDLDAAALNEMSQRIQHCLLTAQKLSRIHGILRFQPETGGQS